MKHCLWTVYSFVWLGLLLAQTAQGQDDPGAVVPPDGSQFYRNLLHLHGLKPVTKLDEVFQLKPEETVIIVFGDLSRLLDLNRNGFLEKFVNNRGGLLIASDRPDHGHLSRFRLELTGDPLRNFPSLGYANKSSCPYVSRYEESHPIFRSITRPIATNNPCKMQIFAGNEYDYLAGVLVPRKRRDEATGKRLIHYFPCIVGSRPDVHPDKRVLFINGHGLFMNQMAALDTVDNARFSINTIKWLTDNGKRKHVLFLEEGLIREKLNVGLAEPPFQFTPEMIDPLLVTFEQLLYGLETENVFDQLAQMMLSPRKVLLYMIIGFTTFVLVRGLRRLAYGRYHKESSLPLVSRTLDRINPATPISRQRQEQARADKHYTGAAQTLTRQWFAQIGVDLANGPPMLESKSHRYEGQIRALWQLAHDGRVGTINAKQLQALYEQLQQLHKRFKEGTLRFQVAP